MVTGHGNDNHIDCRRVALKFNVFKIVKTKKKELTSIIEHTIRIFHQLLTSFREPPHHLQQILSVAVAAGTEGGNLNDAVSRATKRSIWFGRWDE